MRKILAGLVLASSLNASAHEVNVASCADFNVSLNAVFSMKTYANSSIKTFEVDMEEPAAAPAGVAVAIDRGDDLSTREIFCRFVPGLSTVNVKSAKSKFDKATGILTLTLAASKTNENGESIPKTLVIMVNKSAETESELVKATLK